jgi:23S rRNA (cytidine2498-2'-O)-methyltransferase
MSERTSSEPQPLGGTAYLAAAGFVEDLVEELGEVRAVHDRLVLADGPPRPAAWAANTWFDPVLIDAPSIGEGARALRALQRNWALYSFAHHRRATLIEAKLPPVRFKPLPYPAEAPKAPLGSWTLLEPNRILAAARCSSAFRHGEVEFVENKTVPPNRAYLKLWETFTILGVRPVPGEICLDLGASPGGWSWVLQETGANVIAVDKAPLDPKIARLPRVTTRKESAFGLDPAAIGPIDWLFSDVICYPERLLKLVQRWIGAGTVRRLVCTIKFQGKTDHEAARAFVAIPGSRLMHLHHNKHELTWVRL